MNFLQINCYNLDLAKIFGINVSVLLTCIDNEFKYQSRQNSLSENNTIILSRAEIYARTGLDDEEQKDAELALQECGVLTIKPLQNNSNKNYYILYEDQLNLIITSEKPEDMIKNSQAKQFLKKRTEPVSKRQTHIASLKKRIKVEDPVIQTYMCDWIDSVYDKPKGFISPKGVEIAQEELFAYAKTQDVQIALLKIAIKGGLRDLSWAIEQYEKQNPAGSRNFAVYNDIVAEKNTSSSEVF